LQATSNTNAARLLTGSTLIDQWLFPAIPTNNAT